MVRPSQVGGLLAIASLTSCGAGTVAIAVAAGGGGGGGGSTNQPAIVRNLTVNDAKRESPATVSFDLVDSERDPADVRIEFREVNGTKSGVIAILARTSTSPTGEPKAVDWKYGDDFPGLAAVEVKVVVTSNPQNGGQSGGDASARFTVGDDPPQFASISFPSGEITGLVGISFDVSDAATDTIQIKVEYQADGGAWLAAHPFQEKGDGLEKDGYWKVKFSPEDEPSFFWDAVKDLGSTEHSVRLQLTPRDGFKTGQTVASPTSFVTDNNAPPVVLPDGGNLLSNRDPRNGIPLSFTAFDAEGDLTRLLFQWRRLTEDWPDPTGVDLDDPAQRRAKHICSEQPVAYGGSVQLVPGTTRQVLLPELAGDAAAVLASGGLEPGAELAGTDLEILRDPLPAALAIEPLPGLVAALPIADGASALLLEEPTGGTWRLRELVLDGSGAGRSLVEQGVGQPAAMTFETSSASVLVGVNLGADSWQVYRVSLADATVVALLDPALDEVGEAPLRGLACQSPSSAVATVGSSLAILHYGVPGAGSAHAVVRGLNTPTGVVLDPLRAGSVYVAEQDYPVSSGEPGRVVEVDLSSRGLTTVPASSPTGGNGLPHPGALALERSGTRLLALTDTGGDTRLELRALDLFAAPRTARELAQDLPGAAGASLFSDTREVRFIAAREGAELLAGGGVEQTRSIAGYDRTRCIATTSADFAPPLALGRRWRLRHRVDTIHATASGRGSVFVWDSRDVPEGGDVLLRVVPSDTDQGLPADFSDTPKRLARLEFRSAFLTATGIASPEGLAAGDLDHDGLADIVCASHEGTGGFDLTVFHQTSPGQFGPGVPIAPTDEGGTRSVAIVDLDGDGLNDVVAANNTANFNVGNLSLLLQTQTGSFVPHPDHPLANPNMLKPRCVIAADLNQDGNPDLATANRDSNNLTIFLQDGGHFPAGKTTSLDVGPNTDPEYVACGDFDNDGRLDLVTAIENQTYLGVFFQTSADVFTPCVIADIAPSPPYFVAAGDLNEDGLTDIVSANYQSDSLTVCFQAPDAKLADCEHKFTRATIQDQSLNTTQSVALADLTGDGLLDLVSSNIDGTGNDGDENLALFIQTEPGAFAAFPQNPLQPTGGTFGGNPVLVVTADLDGDGTADCVTANTISNNLALFFQTGPGTFSPSSDNPLGDEGGENLDSVDVADLNGDGLQDLVTQNRTKSTLSVFYQLTPGFFAPAPQNPISDPAGTGPFTVTAADLNGDGYVDLVSSNCGGDNDDLCDGTSNLTLFYQDPDTGTFVAWAGNPLTTVDPTDMNVPYDVKAGDLDGDGDLDLVSANFGGGTLAIFRQVSAGEFAPPDSDRLLHVAGPRTVAIADLNGDGRNDLVAGSSDHTLKVLLQNDRAGFDLSSETLETVYEPLSIAVADIDRDGRLDLVSANSEKPDNGCGSASNLTVFFQDTPGSFPSGQRLILTHTSMCEPDEVVVGDLDGDGSPDIATANRFSDNVALFVQTSYRTFRTDTAIGGIGTCRGLAAIDLDGDGETDLAATSETDDALFLFFGNHGAP